MNMFQFRFRMDCSSKYLTTTKPTRKALFVERTMNELCVDIRELVKQRLFREILIMFVEEGKSVIWIESMNFCHERLSEIEAWRDTIDHLIEPVYPFDKVENLIELERLCNLDIWRHDYKKKYDICQKMQTSNNMVELLSLLIFESQTQLGKSHDFDRFKMEVRAKSGYLKYKIELTYDKLFPKDDYDDIYLSEGDGKDSKRNGKSLFMEGALKNFAHNISTVANLRLYREIFIEFAQKDVATLAYVDSFHFCQKMIAILKEIKESTTLYCPDHPFEKEVNWDKLGELCRKKIWNVDYESRFENYRDSKDLKRAEELVMILYSISRYSLEYGSIFERFGTEFTTGSAYLKMVLGKTYDKLYPNDDYIKNPDNREWYEKLSGNE